MCISLRYFGWFRSQDIWAVRNHVYFEGLVRGRYDSIADALELCFPCADTSIYVCITCISFYVTLGISTLRHLSVRNHVYFGGLVQGRYDSIVIALELCLPCADSSIYACISCLYSLGILVRIYASTNLDIFGRDNGLSYKGDPRVIKTNADLLSFGPYIYKKWYECMLIFWGASHISAPTRGFS